MKLPYLVEILNLKIGGLNLKLAQLKDPEKLFDELLSKGQNHPDVVNENIPYWGELWPSAIGLAEFITENPELVAEKKIIEIGCGLGLPGIVSALLNGQTMLTDYLPAALQFAKYNWELNLKSVPNLQLLDWTMPRNFIPADVVIASDIAYESKSFLPVLNALNLLTKKEGIVLLSEPNRGFAKKFFKEMDAVFSYSTVMKKIVKDGIENKISIYTLTKI